MQRHRYLLCQDLPECFPELSLLSLMGLLVAAAISSSPIDLEATLTILFLP